MTPRDTRTGGVLEAMILPALRRGGGSGTTGRVAIELNRRAVLLDLAYTHEYRELAEKRTRNVQRELVVATPPSAAEGIR